MNEQQLARRTERATSETLVIAQVPEGLRVYSPEKPTTFYVVSGTQAVPACSCPDFAYHRNDPNWRCKHLLAAVTQLPTGNGASGDDYEDEERQAIQAEGRRRGEKTPTPASNGLTTMFLKRSVSPDGRIDSLSAEFSCPIDSLSDDEVRQRAEHILAVQSEIVGGFLGHNGSENGNGASSRNGQPETAPASGDKSPAVPARLLHVAGMDGKWGRRLFINVEVNGKTLKLFGNREQIAAYVTAAGFADVAQQVAEGLSLNLPCRVTTKPSPDGRYQNIDAVLPAESPRPVRVAR